MKFLYILFVLLIFKVGVISAQVAVIVNKSIDVSSIKCDKLAEIYALNIQKWENGGKIVVCDLRRKSLLKAQFYSFLKKKPYELRKIWIRVQLTGEGKAPLTFKTEEEIVKKVESTPGAIGYVSIDKISKTVKVIARIE